MSRRGQITLSPVEQAELLADERVVIVSSHGPRGWPHSMPMWFTVRKPLKEAHRDGPPGEIWIWTYAKSQKVKNLERDPRATLQIEDGVQYDELRGVMMECDAELDRDPARVAEYGLALFTRYGADPPPPEVREMVAKQAEKRVGLRFRPTRTVSWDHRKLGGTY